MGNCWSTRVKAESPCSGTRSSRSAVYSRTSTEGKTISPRTEDEILHSSNLKNFSFTELKNATRNFRPDSVLGEGGFGCVFKGWLDEKTLSSAKPGTGMVIAVKKLNHESFQGHKEWLAEVNYLGQLTHPNLVKLIGFCVDDDQRLLVYEFMPKGSLEHHLFRRNSHFQPLSWAIRINISIGAAEGLAYLHDKDVKVIYRDFKPSNILLDSDYSAKLSDFGLAKDGPSEDESHVTTRVMGTYGYAAPEYVATGHLTSRSDVYSFGVVFLELLTGLKAIDKTRIGLEQNLVEWAKPYLKNPRKVFRILDPKLDGQYSEKLALKASFLASECLSTEPKSRPTMRQVVERLKQLQDLNDMRKPTRDNVQN